MNALTWVLLIGIWLSGVALGVFATLTAIAHKDMREDQP